MRYPTLYVQLKAQIFILAITMAQLRCSISSSTICKPSPHHVDLVCRCSKQSCLNTPVNDHKVLRTRPLLAVLQDKVASSQSDTSSSKASAQQSIDVAEMQQGLQKSNAALQDAQSQLYARQEQVQELTQRLEAAQAEVASLQVSGLSYT